MCKLLLIIKQAHNLYYFIVSLIRFNYCNNSMEKKNVSLEFLHPRQQNTKKKKKRKKEGNHLEKKNRIVLHFLSTFFSFSLLSMFPHFKSYAKSMIQHY